MKALPRRHEIDNRYKWDLTAIYATEDAWAADFQRAQEMLPRLAAFKGRLTGSAAELLECLQVRDQVGILVGKLYAYATLRRDEDATVAASQALKDRALGLAVQARGSASFIEPELLAISDELLERFMGQEEGLALYRHMLDELRLQREHVLSAPEEAILAQAGELAQAPYTIFSTLHDADFKFPTIRDEDGEEVELTKGRYLQFMESRDRRVRHDAFHAHYSTYQRHRNTLAATLGAAVKRDGFYARVRRYPSALAAALSANHIPAPVYGNLLQAVDRYMHLMHRYVALRKRVLGLDDLHLYDMSVPMVPGLDRKLPYDEAAATVVRALAPLGAEYVSVVEAGLRSRWVDVYENAGKASGAYSLSSYGTPPYILLNYQDKVGDMYSLAHELGHSLHSHFSQQSQPYIYSGYTLFVAEVASTVNEALLTQYLLSTTTDQQFRLYLLNEQLDSFRVTLFSQTFFAEFEKEMHEWAEAGRSLTADALSARWLELSARYHGPDLALDDVAGVGWGRVPHFYRNFYVYQYATGLSAAAALSRQIQEEGAPAVARYLDFLRGGSSDYPISLLQRAGVDLTTPAPIEQALETFGGVLDQFEAAWGSGGAAPGS